MAQWSDELCLKLIELFKLKTILWDMKNKSYYNRASKEDAWKDIAVTMGKTVDDIRGKMLSLQASYRREKTREKRNNAECPEATSPFISKWYAFEALRFLDEGRRQYSANRIKNTRTSTLTIDQMEHSSDDQKSEDNNTYNSYDLVDLEEIALKQEPDESSGEERGAKRKCCQDSDRCGRDQYSVFGELIGMQIRDLPSTHARNVVKHLIGNILFKAEMGKYNNPLRENYDIM